MTFEYRDERRQILRSTAVEPDLPEQPVPPAIWITTSDGGWHGTSVYIPLDHVEEVIAGIRDAARTAAARQTTGQTAPDPTTADNPTPLRWGLGDVLHGDNDTVTICLSGPAPDRAPYWLELEPEQAAALRDDLDGPAPEDTIGLCGYCGVPRENHHHGYVSTADAIAAAPHRVTARAAVGQPAEAQGADEARPSRTQWRVEGHDATRTGQLILNCLTGRAVCGVPRPADEATGLLDAYRAAVLREAADEAERLRQFEKTTGARAAAQISENVGILRVATRLRRMADEETSR